MRAGRFCLVLAALVAALSGCSGKDEASTRLLSTADFKNKLAAAIITGSDLEGQPGFGPKVDVSSKTSLNTLSLRFTKEYGEYKAHPDRLDAAVRSFVERAKMLMARGNGAETLASARSLVFPLLKPKGAVRHLDEQPATTVFPGNLLVAYAVQRTDSFMVVTHADLARWKQSVGELHRIAVANLVRETKRDQPLKCEEKLCGWASGDGFDASRMIAPELRQEIVKKIGPAVYAVPRESVFVALPAKLAGRIRDKVTRDFVTAPNPVSPDIFIERNGKLVVLPR